MKAQYDTTVKLRKLYDAQALLQEVKLNMNPVLPSDFTARLEQCDSEVEAMARSMDGLHFLDKVIESLIGQDIWAKAFEIAYAPIGHGGFKRVAEYYRRAEIIQQLVLCSKIIKK